ncbi:MAG TPA: glycerate kinase [Panacibacter sp.]|nr:glycerate kinase [Panacibacter sp.]
MHILIAPNAFKNSLSAGEAAEAISKGLKQSKLQHTSECYPIGDGGDGTADLLIKKFNGTIINAEVHDPLFRKIITTFGLIDDAQTAVIELANASGIKLLRPHEHNPLKATTFGTGELIKHALSKNVTKIILCIGGSATVDGGTGILNALGVRFRDTIGNIINPVLEYLSSLDVMDLSSIDKKILNVQLVVLCDVENTLLGENGAAKIFGPQKGANTTDVITLEHGLTKLREVIFEATGKDMALIKHGGAAGGVAAGLSVLLNAKLVPGIEYFLDITGFNHSLRNADLLITGEGSIDAQTLEGKAPFGVAYRAKEKGIPVIGMAGKVPEKTDRRLHQYFDELLAINNENVSLDEALKNTYANLVRNAHELGNTLAIKK